MTYQEKALSEGYQHNGDGFYQSGHRMLSIGEKYMRFHNLSLLEVKQIIKSWDIQYAIDEDNNDGIVQNIWLLSQGIPEYSIRLTDKKVFDNHGTDDSMSAVRNILLDIKKGTKSVDYFLDLIAK